MHFGVIHRAIRIRCGRYDLAPDAVSRDLRAGVQVQASRDLASLVRLTLYFKQATLPRMISALSRAEVPVISVRTGTSAGQVAELVRLAVASRDPEAKQKGAEDHKDEYLAESPYPQRKADRESLG